MKHIIGYYSEQGYEVDLCDNGIVETLYSAGNSPCDSQAFVAPEDGVDLKTMRRYCQQTAKDIAEETNTRFLGVELDED